jgi:hypothetical protein
MKPTILILTLMLLLPASAEAHSCHREHHHGHHSEHHAWREFHERQQRITPVPQRTPIPCQRDAERRECRTKP